MLKLPVIPYILFIIIISVSIIIGFKRGWKATLFFYFLNFISIGILIGIFILVSTSITHFFYIHIFNHYKNIDYKSMMNLSKIPVGTLFISIGLLPINILIFIIYIPLKKIINKYMQPSITKLNSNSYMVIKKNNKKVKLLGAIMSGALNLFLASIVASSSSVCFTPNSNRNWFTKFTDSLSSVGTFGKYGNTEDFFDIYDYLDLLNKDIEKKAYAASLRKMFIWSSSGKKINITEKDAKVILNMNKKNKTKINNIFNSPKLSIIAIKNIINNYDIPKISIFDDEELNVATQLKHVTEFENRVKNMHFGFQITNQKALNSIFEYIAIQYFQKAEDMNSYKVWKQWEIIAQDAKSNVNKAKQELNKRKNDLNEAKSKLSSSTDWLSLFPKHQETQTKKINEARCKKEQAERRYHFALQTSDDKQELLNQSTEAVRVALSNKKEKESLLDKAKKSLDSHMHKLSFQKEKKRMLLSELKKSQTDLEVINSLINKDNTKINELELLRKKYKLCISEKHKELQDAIEKKDKDAISAISIKIKDLETLVKQATNKISELNKRITSKENEKHKLIDQIAQKTEKIKSLTSSIKQQLTDIANQQKIKKQLQQALKDAETDYRNTQTNFTKAKKAYDHAINQTDHFLNLYSQAKKEWENEIHNLESLKKEKTKQENYKKQSIQDIANLNGNSSNNKSIKFQEKFLQQKKELWENKEQIKLVKKELHDTNVVYYKSNFNKYKEIFKGMLKK